MVQAGDQIQIDTEQVAQLRVQHFVRSFEDSYLTLACHAALPLILTPELVNYLRNRFMPGEVPWVAEADLLLSDLCYEVGYETYAMEPDVRSFLINELQGRFGQKRMQDVARLMVNYVRHLARNSPRARHYELQTQQWAALAYLDDQRSQTVKELAESFKACLAELGQAGNSQADANQAEIIRLSKIVEDLKSQLKDYPDLIKYAQLTSEILTAPEGFELDEAESHSRFSQSVDVLGVKLPPLKELKPHVAPGTTTIRKPVSIKRWAYLLGNPYEFVAPELGIGELRNLLMSLGYEVKQRIDIARKAVLDDLRNFAQVGPDDLFFFYCAGPVQHPFALRGGVNSFTLKNVFEILAHVAARKIVVFLDPTDSGPELWTQHLELPHEIRQNITIAVIAPDTRRKTRPGDFSSRLATILKRLVNSQLDQPLKVRDLIESLESPDQSVESRHGTPVTMFQVFGDAENLVLIDGEQDTRVPLRNPFLTPTSDYNRAFGREALISEIVSIIRRDENIWLYGEPGIGKTLILKSLIEVGPSYLDLPQGAVMYFNLSSIRDESEIFSVFYRNLPMVSTAPPDKEGRTFTRLTGDYKAEQLVLCVDNVDRANTVGLDQIFFALKRAGLGDIKIFLVCTSRELDRSLMKSRSRPFTFLYVAPINVFDVRTYIMNQLGESGIEFTEADIEAIYRESKGFPNRVRKLAATVFEKYASSAERNYGPPGAESSSKVSTRSFLDPRGAPPPIPVSDEPGSLARSSVARKRAQPVSNRKTHTVDQKGKGLYHSLKEAVAHAKPFDILQILPGVYTESVIINKPLTISAYGSVQIDSKGKTCIEIRADKCELHGINISGIGRSNQYGVRVVKGNATISDCTIAGFRYDGIEVRPGASAEILRSTFRENLCGICFEGTGKVEDCLIKYNDEVGIFVGSKGFAHVLRSKIDENGYGILIQGGRARIEQNSLEDNQNGSIIQSKSIKGAVELIDNLEHTKARAARVTSSGAVSSPTLRTSKGASKSRPASKSAPRRLKTSSKSGSKSSRKAWARSSKAATKGARPLSSKRGTKKR